VSLLVAVELYEHGPAVGLVVHEREQEQALYDAAHLGDGLDELRLLRAGVQGAHEVGGLHPGELEGARNAQYVLPAL